MTTTCRPAWSAPIVPRKLPKPGPAWQRPSFRSTSEEAYLLIECRAEDAILEATLRAGELQDQSLKLEPRSHTKVVAAVVGIEAAASYIG